MREKFYIWLRDFSEWLNDYANERIGYTYDDYRNEVMSDLEHDQ